MNLGERLHASAERNPTKIALLCGDEAISYRELDRSTTALGRWLLSTGLQPGDRVAIHRLNSIPAVQLFFACFKSGLIAVPVNVRLKAPEIAYILQHSGASICFSQTELSAQCPSDPPLYTELPALHPDMTEPPLPTVAANEAAVILYTSGTTARPKGVTHSHETLFQTAQFGHSGGLDGEQVVLVMMPLMHAAALNGILVPALLAGATSALVPAFNPSATLDAIERFRCTFVAGLPALLQFLAEEQAQWPRNVNSLRTCLAGGDTVPVSLQDRFQRLFGTELLEAYALTESLPVFRNSPGMRRQGSVGRVLEGVEVRVDETGELLVRSPANCIGYWNDPEATAAAFDGGWLRTGDLLRCDGDGYYHFQGRKKEIIIRAGSNISPQEVEEALYQHPAVLEAGVIGVPDPILGERVAAFITLRDGHRASERELREFASPRLADYKLPERIVFLPALPKGPTGKVQRRALKELARSDSNFAHQGFVARV